MAPNNDQMVASNQMTMQRAQTAKASNQKGQYGAAQTLREDQPKGMISDRYAATA